MHILCADSIDDSRLDVLRDLGHQVTVEPSLTADDLPDRVGDHDILVVRSTKVTAETIAAATGLGLIVRAGAGTDNIDIEAASARGIFVSNVPGRNAVAVAELTLGLLLAIDRRIPDNVADLRSGTWNKALYTKADGLLGKRLAIVGVGDIGLAVAERAKGFGLTVTALRKDNRPASVQATIRSVGIRLVDSQEELLADADIVSLHVPKSADTAGLVDHRFLSMLPEGAILLNTSRGDVIDEEALLDALDQGRVRAGLDVYADEPASSKASFSSALAAHPRVVGTHHIGASTSQAQRSVADGTVEAIKAYLDGTPVNCVNLRQEPSGPGCLTIRHLDRVGVLAKVFAVLRSNDINVQQMQNQVFEGGAAAVATIYINTLPDDQVIDELSAIDEVFATVVIPQS